MSLYNTHNTSPKWNEKEIDAGLDNAESLEQLNPVVESAVFVQNV